ncbi:hypothetical protein [Methylocella sp.]|uniref:hypothetical protein n=1 Tax=Methylocella sp. TaxID=1978226 RepID=UPI0037844F31
MTDPSRARALGLFALAAAAFAPCGAARADAVNPLAALSLDALGATRERPLFSPSRRPPAPAIVAAAPEEPPPPPPPAEPETPRVKLIGVVHGAGAEIGLFVDDGGKTLRLRVGQTSDDGWTLRSVDARAASLEKQERVVNAELAPRSADLGAPGGAPAPAPERPVVGYAGQIGAPPEAIYGGRDHFAHGGEAH